MHGRTPHEAVTRYIGTVQQALSVVTAGVVRAGGFDPARAPFLLILSRGAAVPLGGPNPLSLRVRVEYTLGASGAGGNRWTVAVIAYWLTLEQPETEQELMAFHWHPRVAGVGFPHLHPGRLFVADPALTGIHVPTGLIALEDVISFAITELGVRPRRADWTRILERTRAATAAPPA